MPRSTLPCTSRTTAYGPATTAARYVEISGVGEKRHTPPSRVDGLFEILIMLSLSAVFFLNAFWELRGKNKPAGPSKPGSPSDEG